MEIKIEKTAFSELSSLIDLAAKDGIIIYAPNLSDWFCAKANGELVGFVACYINKL